MLKNQNIICISSIDWDFVWQGHQEIMSAFAKNGNRVVFIENTGIRTPNFRDIPRLKKRITNWFKGVKGFREEMGSLYVYSPVILPFPYSRIARWINKRMLIRPLKNWMKIMEFHDPVIWSFLPTGIALDIIDNIEHKLVIYYCIADFYELVDNPRKLKKTEDELIRKSDVIFTQGKFLYNKCSRLNNNVHIFPFGVNIEIFENFKLTLNETPKDIKDIKKPIIGYVGGIHRHIDFGLLRYIAQTHPDWSIVLVGPLQTGINEISNFKNVFFLGKKDFSELPHYINEFDACIIPYLKTDYTETVYPTKLNEYHALGKPVISTELPEITDFNARNENLVLVGKTYEEFINCISEAINSSDGKLIDRRISTSKKNSWVTRIEEMSSLIEKAIESKSGIVLDWREKLFSLYRVSQRKMLKLFFPILSIYLLIFYTPLVWYLAGPLKISQPPEKTDCIVVFAGGVGESGKAGQGYEERIQYAVELYRERYAKYMIFSSGYTHFFKEPLLMKALAVSLGIPEQAIFLEDRAGNTYENVKFSKEILDRNNWREILLISSPYHMRRVSLVFNKFAKEVKVNYTPIIKSEFYFHGERDSKGRRVWQRINLRQIKGILHEYLGIAYYWWRGWV